eukprot:Clim_evm54s142 gene=Clim_evmTU54s142
MDPVYKNMEAVEEPSTGERIVLWHEDADGTPHLEEFETFQEWVNSINWLGEPVLIGVITFHLVIMVMVLLMPKAKNLSREATFFVSLIVLAFVSERANEECIKYWPMLFKKNHCDKAGIFMSLVWTFPLCVNALLMILGWMVASFNDAANLKAKQLRAQHAQRLKEIREGSKAPTKPAPKAKSAKAKSKKRD